jgi:hypothetical protein
MVFNCDDYGVSVAPIELPSLLRSPLGPLKHARPKFFEQPPNQCKSFVVLVPEGGDSHVLALADFRTTSAFDAPRPGAGP